MRLNETAPCAVRAPSAGSDRRADAETRAGPSSSVATSTDTVAPFRLAASLPCSSTKPMTAPVSMATSTPGWSAAPGRSAGGLTMRSLTSRPPMAVRAARTGCSTLPLRPRASTAASLSV